MKQVFSFLFFGIIISTVLFTIPALAECIYRGESFPEGTRVGNYVCRTGEWLFEPQ